MVKHLKNKLYVIAVVSNPIRFKRRWELYRKFEYHALNHGAQLITVECQQGDREFQITDKENPRHVQVRTYDELWIKENMINLAFSKLPSDWEYVAWVDADITFVRPDWLEETIHQLQHYQIVQMWQTAIDLGPNQETISTHYSFIHQYLSGRDYHYGKKGNYYELWHPGFGWAARREAIDHLGGLIEIAILGAADNHMSHAFVGLLDFTIGKGLHPNYLKHLKIWQERAERYIRRDVGIVPGTIIHYWHGKKKDRRYHDRWKILVNNQFDPEIDIKKDSQGILQLHDHGTPRSIKLRDDIRKYFRGRNEDTIDLT